MKLPWDEELINQIIFTEAALNQLGTAQLSQRKTNNGLGTSQTSDGDVALKLEIDVARSDEANIDWDQEDYFNLLCGGYGWTGPDFDDS